MKLLRSAVVLAIATVLLVPSTAQADKYVRSDNSGDVLAFANETSSGELDPSRTNGDVVSSAVVHKARKVILKLKYRDIAWNDEYSNHFFMIRTSNMKRFVTLVAGDGFRGGKVVFSKPSGKQVKCNVARKIDYTANVAMVKVPRSCLNNPRWVRAGMAGVVLTGFGANDASYVDDALTNGTLGAAPKLGPKVRR